MDNKEQKKRQFGLSSLAVDNATSIIILGIMILIFGIQSYNRMPKEQYPEASLPTVYINTPYFGNSAKEIENLIAKPIEKEIASISGIKNVVSTSMQDYSAITAEFDADLDIDDVIRKVKDAVDLAKSELPNDLDEDPRVLEVKFSDLPIMTVNISGRYSMDAMRKFAEYLEDQIESVATISSVDIKGAREREVKIDMDLAKMQALQVAYGDVQNAIQGENLNMSGGEIIRNEFRRAIRVIGQFETVEEIGNVIVKKRKSKTNIPQRYCRGKIRLGRRDFNCAHGRSTRSFIGCN